MQKKSLTITVVALAAMSAVWLGGTWYTGSKIEEQYLKQIDDINQQGWIKIDDVQLERHFFFSDLQYQLNIDEYSYPIQTKIYHGPLPLNKLSQFKLLPVMASSESTLQTDNQNKNLPFYLKNGEKNYVAANPFTLKIDIDYQQAMDLNFHFSPGEYQSDENKIVWSGGEYKLKLDQAKNIHYSINLDDFRFILQSEQKNIDSNILVQGLTSEGKLKLTNLRYLPIGDIKTTIKRAEFNFRSQANSAYVSNISKDQSSTVKLTQDGNFYAIDIDGDIADVLMNEQSLYSQTLKLQINHLSGADLDNLFDASLKEDQTRLHNSLTNLFNQQPQLVIAPLSLKNSDGEATLKANIQTAPQAVANLTQGLPDQFFDSLNIHLNLEKPFLNGVIDNYATAMNKIFENNKQVEPINPERLQQVLQAKLQQQVAQGILLETENAYQLNLEQKEGELYLNQQQIPKEALAFLLISLF